MSSIFLYTPAQMCRIMKKHDTFKTIARRYVFNMGAALKPCPYLLLKNPKAVISSLGVGKPP